MLFVTAATSEYTPGVVGLYRSLKRLGPECFAPHLTCLAYGHDVRAACETEGIDVMDGPRLNVNKPEGRHTANDAMYCRVLLPSMFPDEKRIVWLDCDQVAVDDISELNEIDLGRYAVGMVDTGHGITYQMSDTPNYTNPKRAGFAGLIVIDCEKWREQRITERCLEVMANPGDLKFNFVVQSVLNYVLDGAFMPLEPKWQGFGNRTDFRPKGHKFVHWHGNGCMPWKPVNDRNGMPINNRDIWQRYAS